MKTIIAAMAVALSLCACSTPVPDPQPPQVSTQTPAVTAVTPVHKTASTRKPARTLADPTKQKKKKVKSEPRKESKPVRAVGKERKTDCALVKWAASTFSEERIKTLEGQASAEQVRHAKACLSQ